MSIELRIARFFRLQPATVRLLEALAADMGISRTAIVELAIRDLAKSRKVKA